MLKWRLLLGALIIGSLLGLCILDAHADAPGVEEAGLPGRYLIPVLLVLTVLATQEVLRLARAAGIRPVAWTIYAGNLLLVIAQWLPAVYLYWAALVHRNLPLAPGDRQWLPGLYLHFAERFSWPEMGFFEFFLAGTRNPLWAMAVGMLLIFVVEMREYEQPGGTLAKIAVGVFSLVYVGLMFTFAVQIRLFWGIGAVAAWIISVKMGDIGAYTVGRLIGRTKMSPTISPGKTMEGALGAMLFALLGSWISFQGIPGVSIPLFVRIHFHGIPLPWINEWIPFQGIVSLAPYFDCPGQPAGWIVFGLLMGSRRHDG